MTASRQSGPPQGRGAASDPADQRLALLSATLSEQIIPRLLQAHTHAEGHADDACDYRAHAGRPISSADVKDLVRMVLLPDDRAARASVEAMRLRGIPVETLFIDLLALAARPVQLCGCHRWGGPPAAGHARPQPRPGDPIDLRRPAPSHPAAA
jgi:hypothetical protein